MLTRFEDTGTFAKDLAKSIGLVGLAAGLRRLEEDIRISFLYTS
ncbi:MAG: hypothetical protein WAV89_08290 [Ignavibacteriaceae bacterium]